MGAIHQLPPPSSAPTTQESCRNPDYHKVRPLPTQIQDHCAIAFEEQLYSQALSLLSSTLVAGQCTSQPVIVPPPADLALAATLVIHPSLTTRTTSQDKHDASDAALRLLQQVSKLAGPRNAELATAFHFTQSSTASRRKRARTRQSDVASDDEDETKKLDCDMANQQALWTHAEDFWDAVGWAFNCSVAYKHRWERLKLWLDFMLDVLGDDLREHETGLDIRESLLARYLASVGDGRSSKRRIMRALLADGKPKALAEFGEVWKNETKPPMKKKATELRTRKRKLDLDEGDFGDYGSDASDEDSTGNDVRRSRSTTTFSGVKQEADLSDGGSEDGTGSRSTAHGTKLRGMEALGGNEAIALRQRLLALLSRLCILDETIFLDVEDFFDLCTEFIRPLPLALFQQFVLPSHPYLGANTQASLNQTLLRPLLASDAPRSHANYLTQADLQVHYAPFAANVGSIAENAKVSLLIESLLRLLWKTGSLTSCQMLRTAVGDGIEARMARAEFDGRRKTGSRANEEEENSAAMRASAARMTVLLDMLAS